MDTEASMDIFPRHVKGDPALSAQRKALDVDVATECRNLGICAGVFFTVAILSALLLYHFTRTRVLGTHMTERDWVVKYRYNGVEHPAPPLPPLTAEEEKMLEDAPGSLSGGLKGGVYASGTAYRMREGYSMGGAYATGGTFNSGGSGVYGSEGGPYGPSAGAIKGDGGGAVPRSADGGSGSGSGSGSGKESGEGSVKGSKGSEEG